MALEQKLSLKLTQKLVMTPSLQQAIKLLQMTRMELEGVLTQELVENPVLEESSEIVETPTTQDQPEPVETEPKQKEDPLDSIDFEAYFGDYMEGSGYASIREEREEAPLENTVAREADLYDHLLWQLHMSGASPEARLIAELVIGNLDPEGFLVASFEELVELARCDLAENDPEELVALVEAGLALVRSYDPPGIAYPTLRESLLAQLAAAGHGPESLAWKLIEEHWDAFLRRQYKELAKTLGVELKDLEPAVDLIRSLETRPGRKFSASDTHYIEPDVVVKKIGDDYVIQLNDDGLPKLRVSRAYRRMLQQMRTDRDQGDAQQYIKDKMRSAVWLIKSLDQRQRTIYKVANSIVQQQRHFLDHGIEHLRPMVLRDVAEDIGMHESTVSRVVSNKYIHTPRGLFPMKFFFHSGIDREYGENISSLTVKRKLTQLVENEDPRNPLSDSELMRILRREGIQIARRTVAKYRDELGVPSSNDRKQIF
ncbi:MAG TPA: RNA polymerase factor sigma-54 [Thermoanaerobaculia bacterium]|nr:RNA polymerase factor sigma-54 [Thermoanaerobaculia bacterium]